MRCGNVILWESELSPRELAAIEYRRGSGGGFKNVLRDIFTALQSNSFNADDWLSDNYGRQLAIHKIKSGTPEGPKTPKNPQSRAENP